MCRGCCVFVLSAQADRGRSVGDCFRPWSRRQITIAPCIIGVTEARHGWLCYCANSTGSCGPSGFRSEVSASVLRFHHVRPAPAARPHRTKVDGSGTGVNCTRQASSKPDGFVPNPTIVDPSAETAVASSSLHPVISMPFATRMSRMDCIPLLEVQKNASLSLAEVL